MIIKEIRGLSSSGKTTELMREIEGNTIIFSKENDYEDFLRIAIRNKGISIGENVMLVKCLKDVFYNISENKTNTVLFDDEIFIKGDESLFRALAESGVKKIAYTTQLNSSWIY